MTIAMTIDGKSVPGAARMPVENPALGTDFAEAPDCSPAVAESALAAAVGAQPGWAGTEMARRREALLACGRVLAGHADEVAELLTREQGKPLSAARAEVGLAADWFGHTADLDLDEVDLVRDGGRRITMRRVPAGPVVAIAPANFPIILAVTKIAPAVLAGNAVVFKPSPLTPLSSLRMGELLGSVLPPGVLNTVSGGATLGRALATDPRARMISFTGSVETGISIAAGAATNLAKVLLELGGNDACVVLPDADPERVAAQVFRQAMTNSGQFCAAIKRVYVPRARERAFVEALAEAARSTAVGDGLDPATELGPVVSRPALTRLAGMVDDAVRAGAQVVTGGAPLAGPGHFYPPTIVRDLPPHTRLEDDEQFGPALPVIAYDRLAEAVDRANSTRFALGGSVWGDPRVAVEVAGALECGTVWLNTHGELRHDVPFGGLRHSGLGVEYGYWGLLEYTRIRVDHAAGLS
nr:aldehyde dehydrogenase family protein [Micromonospora sp. DSM 115978]